MPTVIKITEEVYAQFCVRVLGMDIAQFSSGSGFDGSHYSRRTTGFPLSSLNRTNDRADGRSDNSTRHIIPDGIYNQYDADIGVDEEGESMNSREEIVSGTIKVIKEYHVSSIRST